MQRGDGVLAEGRYRDQSFFLSHNKEGRWGWGESVPLVGAYGVWVWVCR